VYCNTIPTRYTCAVHAYTQCTRRAARRANAGHGGRDKSNVQLTVFTYSFFRPRCGLHASRAGRADVRGATRDGCKPERASEQAHVDAAHRPPLGAGDDGL
jgi:hypothetical protein